MSLENILTESDNNKRNELLIDKFEREMPEEHKKMHAELRKYSNISFNH